MRLSVALPLSAVLRLSIALYSQHRILSVVLFLEASSAPLQPYLLCAHSVTLVAKCILILFYWMSFRVTGVNVGIVLFQFVYPFVGTGLVPELWILLATGVVPSCRVGLLANSMVVLGT